MAKGSTFYISGQCIGNRHPMFAIAGPCVIEGSEITFEIAHRLKEIAQRCGILIVFKSSFDKANRTSRNSYRGPGLERGLAILEEVRARYNLPVITDVHEATPIHEVAAVVDIIQTPAFLARQTDFIDRVARANKPLNIKKAQFMSPAEMLHVVEKCRHAGNESVMLCERGSCFGYNELVVDMRGLAALRRAQCPVVFDATHSVQKPAQLGARSGGERAMVPVLARAAVAAGVAGVFMETHVTPDDALSDGPNMWPIDHLEELLRTLIVIDRAVKTDRFVESVVDDTLQT